MGARSREAPQGQQHFPLSAPDASVTMALSIPTWILGARGRRRGGYLAPQKSRYRRKGKWAQEAQRESRSGAKGRLITLPRGDSGSSWTHVTQQVSPILLQLLRIIEYQGWKGPQEVI
ncbi:unnamed protein product [Lepidochelys kempii]